MVGLVSGLAAACSTDTARFSQSPFSNPFSVSGGAEPTATGSLPERAAATTAPMSPAVPTAPVVAQPLAPPSAPTSGATFNQPPAVPRQPAAVATSPAPVAPRAVASNGPTGWSPIGGSTVTVGPGDSLQALSTRYGVPAVAILQANGLSTASQLTPGRTVVIPVFNAVGAPTAASAPVAPRPAASAPAPRPAPVAARPAPAPVPQPQMRLVEGAKPAPTRAAPAATPQRAEPARPAPVAARPAQPAPAPARTAARPESARPEPAKPVVQAQAPAPQRPAAPAPAPQPQPQRPVAQAPAPAPQPAQPAQPQRVAALGNPAVASNPAPAPAPQPARPEPTQTASLPASPSSNLDFRWPARGRVISGFGSGGNEGINIAVPEGTPVRAAEGGTVAYAGNELRGYGNLVLIRHDNGYVSAYAHNGEIGVKRGDKVTRGQVIAKSGQSGNVNSPQLHFEIRKGSTPVDPMPYLSN